jgi:dTDP-4-dehydrorhamnose 3,5-epimerase
VNIPSGLLHGFQVLSDVADVCYRMDREHDPSEDRAYVYDDRDLGISWPLPVARSVHGTLPPVRGPT